MTLKVKTCYQNSFTVPPNTGVSVVIFPSASKAMPYPTVTTMTFYFTLTFALISEFFVGESMSPMNASTLSVAIEVFL